MPQSSRVPADDELFITREFAAPLALVWRMWEDRELMFRWWGPEGFTVTELDRDFRVGGRWRVGMISERYGKGWSGGVFREIVPQERLVFTFAWEEGTGDPLDTLATVTFEETAGKTIQHFHQTPFGSIESRDSHVGGWNSLFNKQAAFAVALAADPASPPA
jgi:uncharacterized protein YndB with AHSA1/START domain